jgi:hypothetical protein
MRNLLFLEPARCGMRAGFVLAGDCRGHETKRCGSATPGSFAERSIPKQLECQRSFSAGIALSLLTQSHFINKTCASIAELAASR